jgi:hypothetical protein
MHIPVTLGKELTVLDKAGESEIGRVEFEERRFVAEAGVIITRAHVQQEGWRNSAVVIQPCRVAGNKCPAITSDFLWKAIRVSVGECDLAHGVDSGPIERHLVLRRDNLIDLYRRYGRVSISVDVTVVVVDEIGVLRERKQVLERERALREHALGNDISLKRIGEP